MAQIDGNVVQTNKDYWEYLTSIESLCSLIFLKCYRGYKGTKQEKLKELEKLVNEHYDAWSEIENDIQKQLDEVAGYDENNNEYTYRDAFDVYDFAGNKPGVKLTKERKVNES